MNNPANLVIQATQPQTTVQTSKQPAAKSGGKDFRQMIRDAAANQSTGTQQQSKPATQTAQADNDTTVQQMENAQVTTGVAPTREAQGKWNFLASLFGANAVEGVDMNQSDSEILKDVYNNVTDPDARFAILLMLSFMEANPDTTIDDFQQQIGNDLLENQTVSPLQKTFSAITKMLAADDSLKSSPMLNGLLELSKNPQATSRPVSELFMQELKMQVISNKTGEQTQPVQVQPTQTKESQPIRFEELVAQAKALNQTQTGGTGEKRESGVSLDVDRLQQQVDAGNFLRPSAYHSFRLEQAGAVHQGVSVDAQEFVNQVKTGILAGVEQGDSEFVFRLRPEGLGELTVRLVETGAKTTLSIIASSAQTQRLLTSEISSLQAAMKPYAVEVQPVQTSGQTTADNQQFTAGQFAQQQFGEHNHGGQFHRHNTPQGDWQESEPEQTGQPMGIPQSVGNAALDTYI